MTFLSIEPHRDEPRGEDPLRRAALDELVRLATTGEQREEAFRRLFREYFPRVRAFFSKRTGSPTEIEDLAQETFLRAHRGLVPFTRSAAFEAWLFEIAGNVWNNACRDRHAAKRTGQEAPLELLDSVSTAVASPPGGPAPRDPLRSYLDREQLALIDKALGSLPAKMRLCTVLRYHQDLKYREIADVTGIGIGTVKAHLYQAHKKLKDLLGAYFDVPEEDDA
jgi:RNA polymerase sigma-70 factor, ECF subfamily